MKHYNSLYVMDQKNLSIPKPGGERGENVIVALDAFHSAVARVSNSDGVGVARPMDPLTTAQALGLSLPSPAYLLGAVLFGLIGLWAYRFGKRTERQKTRWIGLALMLFPYAVSETWLLYLVGAALCGWVWFDCR